MKKRILAAAMAAALCTGLLAGCGGSDSSASSAASKAESAVEEAASKAESAVEEAASKAESAVEEAVSEVEEATAEATGDAGPGKRIIFSVKNTNSDFFVSMVEHAKAKAEEYGWTLEVIAPIEADNNEEQIEQIEQSLLDPPDAYLVCPANSDGITPAIEEINEAGIPVVNVNTKFYDPDVEAITYVAADNTELGRESMITACEMIGGKGKMLILEGTTGAQTAIDRLNAANEVLKDYPDVEVLDSQTANYMRQEGMTVTQNLLQKFPEVDVIWAAAGEMALGAAEAVKQANRQDEIKIVTINGFKEMIEAVVDGRIAATTDDASWLQGEMAVEALHDYWEGKELAEHTVVPSTTISDENIDQFKAMYNIP